MRLIDPGIELVTCGSSGGGMATFGAGLEVELRGASVTGVVEHCVLADEDPEARNTLAEPERAEPRAGCSRAPRSTRPARCARVRRLCRGM